MPAAGRGAHAAISDESVISDAALADPFLADLTLERDFLSLAALAGVLPSK